ncbi:MAG: hypothetical protein IRY99_28095, partial [Isosphaeraceae bacterium]|nr:hypothetical protein [Isosphaeraceae bacterium]
MQGRRKRPASVAVTSLERRLLQSLGLTGAWLGQDGHDLVGPSPTPGPSEIQDIHLALAGLPADRVITSARVQGLGGGDWRYPGGSPAAAALVRQGGATSADLYIEPYQVETGRPFYVDLTFDDGTTADLWIAGGAADPNLRMPDAQLQLAWLGQDGHDLVGNGPAVGPDGVQDVHLVLSHLSTGLGVPAVSIHGPDGLAWEYGLNPSAANNAELVRRVDDPSQADLYLNPDRDLSGQPLTVTVRYSNGTTDSQTINAGQTDPALPMP